MQYNHNRWCTVGPKKKERKKENISNIESTNPPPPPKKRGEKKQRKGIAVRLESMPSFNLCLKLKFRGLFSY